MLALAAAPFVGLFPEPPAFGRGALGIVAAAIVLAIVGMACRAPSTRRRRIIGRAAILLAITIASIAVRSVLARTLAGGIPTLDVLPATFGLQGEDIDDAVLYEGWLEVWFCCALVTAVAIGSRRAVRPQPAAGRRSPWDIMVSEPVASTPWNAATVLLWLIGLALLVGAIVDGHWTATFLDRAVHVTGTIADAQPHPRIRFTTANGTVVEYVQNGSVYRSLGADVPVAYLPEDPAGSARADTFWANWSDLLGLLWIGLCFTLLPFYGFRAAFRAGRY